MSAIRLARGVTGRSKILKFEGSYHGHADSLLIKAGSGVATLGLPDSPGVPEGVAVNTITVPYNDLESVSLLLNVMVKNWPLLLWSLWRVTWGLFLRLPVSLRVCAV